ncbi:hypothetical protein ONS95_011259 [Cadophora gregata]|uniref:uncharacterized protein n=1 Tax=Cadophora gregata TaxID=51156 RepID=UPI0026DC276E|nr:uncharacterized protein ONS95_011259 [Cadophora gregata]KAK0119827.1 hypothetical protein ONS95_011259 [Cadophora gregata]KAK0120863.1 hypothetical protein ONS96_011063 [Cadophora gregata f. sp. sojae]
MATLTKALTEGWLYNVKKAAQSTTTESPNYWSSDASNLITTSRPLSFNLGTGAEILTSTLQKCESTSHELIIVTCFWAKSISQEQISSLLLKLSSKGLSQNRKINVRLCFSSRSIAQKLFQTSSLNGKVYSASTWADIGLPAPEDLTGLDMDVKSVFVRPFSVMHPKFILVDRKLAFMPSCNVSWENWFEGCIEMRGGIAAKLFDFWVAFWAQGKTSLPASLPQDNESEETNAQLPGLVTNANSATPQTATAAPTTSLITQRAFPPTLLPPQTILLPSPHHLNPRFLIVSTPPSPPTPLNLFLLQAFSLATSTIYIQTPNITCFPVIAALRSALNRGVDVHLVTSSRLMILEQLVTAGTVTEFEMWKLRRWYRKVCGKRTKRGLDENVDIERGEGRMGGLKIGYYHPSDGVQRDEEPVKSHLKLVIVDEEVTVLGSGNMDRASWYTSQELGIAYFSKDVASEIRKDVDAGLERRVEYVC